MAGRRRYKIARVTPRLGNGPRFGTCSVFLHNIRQMFSIQHHLHWFKRTKFEGTQQPEKNVDQLEMVEFREKVQYVEYDVCLQSGIFKGGLR